MEGYDVGDDDDLSKQTVKLNFLFLCEESGGRPRLSRKEDRCCRRRFGRRTCRCERCISPMILIGQVKICEWNDAGSEKRSFWVDEKERTLDIG